MHSSHGYSISILAWICLTDKVNVFLKQMKQLAISFVPDNAIRLSVWLGNALAESRSQLQLRAFQGHGTCTDSVRVNAQRLLSPRIGWVLGKACQNLAIASQFAPLKACVILPIDGVLRLNSHDSRMPSLHPV